jgi:hypothetical protein
MSRIRKQLTLPELRPFVADYHRAFPGWQMLAPEIIARESGPLLQYIALERLSTGSYRPTCGVYYLCVPERDGSLGPQWLNIKLRIVDPRAHERLHDKVIEAIHREIVPSVDTPLLPEKVLALHEGRELIRSPDAHHLAVLNAYLGRNERALYWCSRFPELVNHNGLGWQDFDHKRQAFLTSLKQWIEVGQVKQQLDCVIQAERRHWGLA